MIYIFTYCNDLSFFVMIYLQPNVTPDIWDQSIKEHSEGIQFDLS